MAATRKRATGSRPAAPRSRSPQRRSSAGGGLPIRFLFLGALLLVGLGTVFARETALGRGIVSAEPSPSAEVAPVANTTAPAVAERSTVSTPKSTPSGARPVAAAPTATHTSTAVPRAAATIAAATRAPTAGPRATATSAPSTSNAPTPNPVGSATSVPVHGSSQSSTTGSAGSVALTFDAGADRGYAEDILDILAEHHALASFGVTGVWAKANPDLVRRMAADGHLVINHTLDHRSFTGVSDNLGGLTAARRRTELDEADAILAPLIGHSTRPFYRLPYGDDDARVAADLAADGYTRKVGWTVDSLGWRGSSSSDILARCLKLAAPGSVYVFHVGKASQDALALPTLIGSLRERGYGFVRVDTV